MPNFLLVGGRASDGTWSFGWGTIPTIRIMIEKLSLRRRSKRNCSVTISQIFHFCLWGKGPDRFYLVQTVIHSIGLELQNSIFPQIPMHMMDVSDQFCVCRCPHFVWSFKTKLSSSGHENQFGMNGWNWVSGVRKVFTGFRITCCGCVVCSIVV